MTFDFKFRHADLAVGFSLKSDGWLVQAAAKDDKGIWFWNRWMTDTLADAFRLIKREGFWKPTV